ncbi:hypothetical protein GCM10027429_15070 [Marivirga atlantica]|jgi:hypothetical protein|uniref:Secretion system C-terminal sorting domain-containing protein n=1 Tax=Marivirga atlantica TaxID=1548457 RepID=A0A937DGT1_9BACT|nr:hypothetical protein [Marivirga atlantica]MBL0765123.1 hypothetical protein [Marivirga atlantica]
MFRVILLYIFIIQAFGSYELMAEDTYIRGFYHGQNVFIRNSFLEANQKFCIQQIYVNGELSISEPDVSAVEIDLSAFNLEDRIVLRIIHQDGCKPELINPEVIQNDISFSWINIYVNEEEILWITSKESSEGFYVIEKEIGNIWEPIDTAKTKGNIFINQHSVALDHIPGNNNYRVVYYPPKGDPSVSSPFKYFSDKREISHAIDTDKWSIEFTEEVSFQLLNANSRVIKRGKGVSYNIRRLPKGTYILKYEGKEYTFEKTVR